MDMFIYLISVAVITTVELDHIEIVVQDIHIEVQDEINIQIWHHFKHLLILVMMVGMN